MHLSTVFVLGFLFVSFRPSRSRSHSRSTGASLLLSLSGFPLSFCILSSASVPVLTTQPSVLSFPFFPFSPDGGSSGASFLFRPACFHAFLPISVLSFLHFFSPLAVSPHSGCLSASAFLLSVSGLFPMAFALGSGYSAFNISSSETSARVSLSFCRELLYNIIFDSICQRIFYKFQNFYFPVFYGFPDSPHPAPIWKQPIGSHPAGPVLPVINGALF